MKRKKQLQIAIKLNPKNTDAYKARAMARISMEDKKGALEDVKKAMEIDPQDESSKIFVDFNREQ